ncbi:spermidine/putrescine ABC transporter permease [Arthrobacter sp. ERGS1:01]|uniref:ABC transporter permease n=1 Tax=Arthrobacter sp. ERGS1:01 TaxID=1704044 RepID=UPI0006B6422D|nr:ABC transporter permease [Arthrobacter sp. ERGS1:01]ALE05893.1 spermidine/putrescine ABC transporter permease [Arthrobacter sp. ERGS1:01]
MSRFSRKSAGVAALSFPTWAYMVFFFVIPVALVIWYSFGYKPDLFTAHSNDILSLDRYFEATDPTFISTFWNTLQIAGIGTLICLVIGVPFAYWMAVKVPAKWRGLLIALVLVPFWTNFLVRTLGWQIMLAPEGFVSDALQNMHLIGGPIEILYTRAAVQLGVVYNYLPLMILPLFVALDRAGVSLREASRDLGANRWRTMWQVTLPLAAPGIASGCLLVFIPLMGDYITASVLGGAQGNMVGQLVANQFNSAQNWALGSAMAVVLMLFIMITVAMVGVCILIVRLILRYNRRVLIEESAA